MSDMEGLAERRKRAGNLFERGATHAEVARELDGARESARRWYEVYQRGGAKALATIGQRGRRSRLSDSELARVEKALLKGALAHGCENDLWTTGRVAAVIERLTGVAYHPGHVWRLLRQTGWTPQRPAPRPVERRDEPLEPCVRNPWPKVKKTPGAGGPGSSSRTSRASR